MPGTAEPRTNDPDDTGGSRAGTGHAVGRTDTYDLPDSDVLVLGGGFAGVWCVRKLERLLGRRANLTLVSAENYFVYQPLLPEVVGASLDPRHAIAPLRKLCPRTRVVRAHVERIDLARHEVELSVPAQRQRLRARGRHLVIALGNIVDVSAIPGMATHGLLMKNLADALALRQAILARLELAVLERDRPERAALLTFVVIGGGFSGVETAAAVLDLLAYARRWYPGLGDVPSRVVLAQGRDRLLPELDAELAEYARVDLERRGMEIRLRTRATSISGRHVWLDDGSTIPARTVVCTIGNAPHPVLRGLGVEERHGYPVADEQLRLQGHDDVWILGDCAFAPDGRGGASTPTAQFAVRQGAQVAANVVRVLRGQQPQPFRHRSLGELASLGHRTAVARIGRFRCKGFFAWWLWRTVYMTKLPNLESRLRLVMEWTLDLFFRRDLNYVDVRVTPAVSTLHLEAGEVLFRQGEASDAFYVVVRGGIELAQQNAEGDVVLREVLGPGAHFGEGSLLRKAARTTTATAVERSDVLVLGPRDFEDLVGAFALLRRTLEHTAQRFLPAQQVLPADVPAAALRLPVARVMSTPAQTLPIGASLREGLEQFVHHPLGCWPLVDENGVLAGIVTRSDLYRAVRSDPRLESPLAEFATRQVLVLQPEDGAGRCVEVMRRAGVKHVPIVDAERHVIGVVSFRDLVRELLALRIAQADAGAKVAAAAAAAGTPSESAGERRDGAAGGSGRSGAPAAHGREP